MVDSLEEYKSLRSIAGKDFPNFELLDAILSWSTTTFESLVPMIPFLIMLRYEMGWNSIVYDQDPIGWCSGQSVQNENTWVRSTQNCIRIVRHGNSSEDIDAQLSEVEDDGEKEPFSETSVSKFRRRFVFLKEKMSLLSVESKRSVIERRPMQFPTRESWSSKTDTILWATKTKR